jgi:hypothetical protein
VKEIGSKGGFPVGSRFFFLNQPEYLDEAGEYWLDQETGMLYLLPPTDAADAAAADTADAAAADAAAAAATSSSKQQAAISNQQRLDTCLTCSLHHLLATEGAWPALQQRQQHRDRPTP